MNGCERLADAQRRVFLTRAGVAVVGGASVTTQPARSAPAPGLARVTYPSSRLGNLKDLRVNEPKAVTYPDAESPGVLVKLGVGVEGGVGPEGDVVAFSTQCPHKGFPLFYRPDDRTLSCPGHYSRYDCERGGMLVWGHATQNLPQFKLRVTAEGDIVAEGVDELIYGRTSNILT